MQIIGALHVSILPGAPQILGLTLKTGTISVPFHVAGIEQLVDNSNPCKGYAAPSGMKYIYSVSNTA